MELSRPARFCWASFQPDGIIHFLLLGGPPGYRLAIWLAVTPSAFPSSSARIISSTRDAVILAWPSGTPDVDGSATAGSVFGRCGGGPAGCSPVPPCFAGGVSPSDASWSSSLSENSLSDRTTLERFSGGPAGCSAERRCFAGGVSPSDASRSSSLSENSLSDRTTLERFSGGPARCLPLPRCVSGGASPSDASRSSSWSENSLSDRTTLERFNGGLARCLPLPPSSSLPDDSERSERVSSYEASSRSSASDSDRPGNGERSSSRSTTRATGKPARPGTGVSVPRSRDGPATALPCARDGRKRSGTFTLNAVTRRN